MDVRSPFFQNIASVLIGVMFLNPIVSTAAELAVDAAAGSNTSLSSAGNGVPIVNIATANGSGLSHNRFSDYNVGQQGLILNNATDKLQSTQLGGYIVGNSNLNGHAASIILNEVNGGNPSQLKGYTEVAGQSAHVIVANPHGITCDGCGFINTPKTTLTTGKPVVEEGRLARYDVDSGEIAIEGQGLNAGNVDQFELITRSAKLNAELQANKLSIIAGRNEVDAQSLAATAKAADGSVQPQLAIDSSALGGMYAGAIRLVGTEQGVGVKLAGDMAASAGDIHIDASGQLSLARTAASGNIDLKAQSISLNDSVYAGQDARVTAADRITVGTSLAAAGNVNLKGQHIDNQGNLEAGVKADGSGNAASTLDIQGGVLTNQGEILARGQLSTDLASIDNRHAQLVAVGSAEIKAGTVDNRGGTLLGQQVLSVTGDSLDNRGGIVASNKALTITANGDVRNGDDGLILSKADGLRVQAQNLDNAGGTVQANSGDLQASGTNVLNNNGGKILTGAGKVTLGASELRNQHGVIEAQGGGLTMTTTTLDNSQGRVVANSVEITSSTRLNNDHGHIVATQGDLRIKQGEILNHAGQLSAWKNLNIDADSLDNQGGTLGGETIDLAFAGLLGNANGLIEAGERLDITAGSLSNTAGKLRAVGQNGKSQFSIGGLFNNDSGLVEIGNAQFALSSQGLSNQAGTVRHVGNQGFDLALADAGQAGGSFITNGELSLDVADWSNSSLLQAQKLTLKVGTFTQTATGKLLSVEDIEASGTNWINDGSIETDGALQLILSGSYQGNGALKSQGNLKLVAASANLGAGADLRSGGQGTFSLGSSLVNAGRLSAAGNLLLQAASLENSGTVGAGQALRIEAPILLNRYGLIFSGADMVLRSNSLTNLRGNVYSLGSLEITKDDALQRAALIENISGTLESAGDMRLLADSLINRKEKFATQLQQSSGTITLTGTDNCKGEHCEASYSVTETYGTVVTQDSARANLIAGGDLIFTGGAFDNRFSTVAAAGDLAITADNFWNTGAGGGEQRYSSYYIYTKSESAYYGFVGNIPVYNDYHNPNSLNYNPAALPLGAVAIGSLTGYNVVQTSGAVVAQAIVQAGGQVNIQATQNLSNSVIRPGEAIDRGASLVGDTGVSLTDKGVAHLNAQLPPDLAQQAVDPLSLPGFSLPQGQNGLFRVSLDPSHPYLIETNPLFASLKTFLGSDYLLNALGYSEEQTMRRLGDGTYEQRLIREALVERTGKRFLGALTSDEAMFRYLMDNAIASKDKLDLSVGVSLTSEQVAALTHDIVWMEEREVTGEKVLVPVLYLAQAQDRLAPTGALIQGADVALISGGELKNQGTLRASNNLAVTANNITNSGLMQANERLSLLATESIRNTQGGIIKGKDVSAIALTGDIVNERSIGTTQGKNGGFQWRFDSADNAARIEASNDLSLSAGRDILNIGGALKAGGDASLDAGRDLVIASAEETDSASARGKRWRSSQEQITQHGSDVQVGGDLAASAGGDLAVIASTVKAGGDVALNAEGDVTIASAANESHSEFHRKGGGKKIDKEDSSVRQQSSVIEAGGDLDITAGNNLIVSASQLKAGDEAYLYAGDQLALLSAENSDYHLYDYKKKGSWGSEKTQKDETTKVRNVGSTIETGGDLTLVSEGDQLYQKARLDSDGDLTLDSGGAITFEAVKDLDQESHEKSDNDWAWTSMEGKGTTDETLRQSVLLAKGDVVIKAVDGLHIDIKQVDQQSVSQTIDAMASADPELAWIKEAEKRGDVDWRRVKEIHDSFKYANSGLGAGAQLIIAIVMAAVVGPMAAGALGTVGGAAATSLATTGVTSTINNKGNLGAVLKETFSSDSLKNAAVAGATAGLTEYVFDGVVKTKTDTVTGKVTTDLSSLEGVGRFAGNQVLQSGASTALNKALGRDVDFNDALQGALFNTLAAAAFNAVGDYSEGKWEDGSPQKVAIHALVGGLLSEATGGDFKTGALAAGANELLVDQLNSLVKSDEHLLLMTSQLVGVAAAGLTDGDMENAAWVNNNATQYNYLNHAENQERWEAKKKCDGGDAAACGRAKELDRLDRQRDLALVTACGSGGDNVLCGKLQQEAWDAAKSLKNAGWSPEAQAQYQEAMRNPALYAYTIEAELRSNIALNDPIAATQVKRLAASLGELGSEFIPVYGDAKAFAEAEDAFDYLAATLGVVPGVGDAAGKVIKRAKELYHQGEVKAAADLVEGLAKSPAVSGVKGIGAGGAADNVASSGGSARPTPKQSEIDVGTELGSGARPQVSYKNGQEVPYGTAGSVRPDWCIGSVCSVEVKNYKIATNQQGLINNVSKQALQRAENLPQGMQQQVVIDIRGQVVTDAQKNAVIKGIVQRSKGAITPTDIRFKSE